MNLHIVFRHSFFSVKKICSSIYYQPYVVRLKSQLMVKMNRASLSTWCLYSGENAGKEKIQYLLSRGLCQLALKDHKPLLHEKTMSICMLL